MTDLMTRVDSELERATTEVLKRRITAWKQRLLGRSYLDISESLEVSIGTVHADVRWCHENLPLAFETAQDLRHVALERLESWILALSEACVRGDEGPIKTSAMLTDMQFKALGAYAPSRIDATVHTHYELVDVKTEDV